MYMRLEGFIPVGSTIEIKSRTEATVNGEPYELVVIKDQYNRERLAFKPKRLTLTLIHQ